MTRDEANKLIASYAESLGGKVDPLNQNNMAALTTGEADLFFTFHQSFFPNKPAQLECSARVYRFRAEPKPELLAALKAEPGKGTSTGGGDVDYEEQNKGLFLTRMYSEVPAAEQFRQDMSALMQASKQWSTEVLQRVSQQVFHPGP